MCSFAIYSSVGKSIPSKYRGSSLLLACIFSNLVWSWLIFLGGIQKALPSMLHADLCCLDLNPSFFWRFCLRLPCQKFSSTLLCWRAPSQNFWSYPTAQYHFQASLDGPGNRNSDILLLKSHFSYYLHPLSWGKNKNKKLHIKYTLFFLYRDQTDIIDCSWMLLLQNTKAKSVSAPYISLIC